MNNEKKSNTNQRNSKRRSEKVKEIIETNVGGSSSHNDSSSSSENFQKELVEVFEKCIEFELRQNESNATDKVVKKLDNLTVDQKYESPKRNKIDSKILHTDNENLNLSHVTCSEINGIDHINLMGNKKNSNSIDSNKNEKEFLESNNNRQELKNGLQKKTDCSTTEAISINTNAQISYTNGLDVNNIKIEYKEYESEVQMQDIMKLIQAELSEPYSIYTYRYFIYNWPKLCFLATHGNKYVGAIVCKLDMHVNVRRGYIAMLAVKKEYRKLKIGTNLVQKAIDAMLADNADEVVLETEMKNVSALRLYENLGFVRDKRLFRYYLNGVDALRLKLWFN